MDAIDFPRLWEMQGPEPEELTAAAEDAVALARSGAWVPTVQDIEAAILVRDVTQWTRDYPLGRPVGEVALAFADALSRDLSEPMRRVLTRAARWEPVVPRPETWGEYVQALISGRLDH